MVVRRHKRQAIRQSDTEEVPRSLDEGDAGLADDGAAFVVGDHVERRGDLVHPAVDHVHGVVDLRLACDAAHLPNDKSATLVIHHLEGGGDHVSLTRERLPVRGEGDDVREVHERVTVGDVERLERRDRLLAEDLSVGAEVVVHALDVGQILDVLLLGGQGGGVNEPAVVDRVIG